MDPLDAEERSVARVDNPFAVAPESASRNSIMEVESTRAVAETQAALIMARKFPRDQAQAMDMIIQDCTLPKLAEASTYDYRRGGSSVVGPTIRLAEAIARRWGNLECGVVELSRQEGFSTCMAYAWDLETQYRERRTFQVRHWRDTQKGGYEITDERDIYELVANMGARRKRACILALLPPDVIEKALHQCEVTMRSKVVVDDDLIAKLLDKFAKHNVTKEMLEKRIQRRLTKENLTPQMAVQLGRIFNSLEEGASKVDEWFKVDAPAAEEKTTTPSGRKRAQRKSGGDKGTQDPPPPSQSVDLTKIADESQLKFVRNKATAAAVTDVEICKAFKLAKLEDLRAAVVPAVLKWLDNPMQPPSE